MREISRSVYGQAEVVFQNACFTPETGLQNLLRLFMEESGNRQPGYKFILESLSIQITVNLLRQVQSNLQQVAGRRNLTARDNINRAIAFLREQYNGNYSLEDVARVANLSPYHFTRLFKAQTGKTPFEYLLDIKLEKAREMLQANRLTVTEVCFSCGFNNLSHFTTVFKRKTGMSPSGYRKEFLGI